jgi:S-adenosylmethionine-diacylglycerol 3-amino-3-carboxypropyl transferase
MPETIAPAPSLRHRAQDAAFKRVHGGNLVYNTCWEDPRVDRELMGLDGESRVVMITSAGCNALDYLLDGPAEIHAVDMNPRQNALLQLKSAMIRRDRFEDLFALFGEGAHRGFARILREELSPLLHPYADRYWKAKSYYFKTTPLNPSFYYRGTAGQMAWIALQGFVGGRGRMRDCAVALLEARSLEEQRELYERVRPILWTKLVTWLLRQPVAMAMLGVPRAQVRLIEASVAGGVPGFLRAKLEHILTEIPFWENYFWQVYLRGRYTRDCCPNYLREEHQPLLRERLDRIRTHSSTIANFLREHPAAYSHYVLLDHQDWMAAHRPDALEEEWRLILENSRPGTLVLMRSASPSIDFIPEFARERLAPADEAATAALHQRDRVGTYGCTLLARVTA